MWKRSIESKNFRGHRATRSHRGSERTSECPETRKLKKCPHKKNASQYLKDRSKRYLPGLTGFGGFMANRSSVLWCRRDLWVNTGHSNLPCFDLRRKTTPNNQRASKPCKMVMNWVQITQKKQQQAQVYVSKIYFHIYAYISRFSQQNQNSRTKSLNRS